jgi:hypothetical protein
MANMQFVEEVSQDPYTRKLQRRAVRLLNDPTLDEEQVALHIRRLQVLLAAYQAEQAGGAQKRRPTKTRADQIRAATASLGFLRRVRS